MAQATHNPAITRTEIFEVTPETITLVLSMEEATALMAVCQRIGGDRYATPRKHFESISRELRSVGVKTKEYLFEDKYRSIYFKVAE
jgi:hypothetical protein